MNGEKINNPSEGLRILVAPLDWGLGHATRCIPIIYALINTGASVFLAGENATEAILKKEFPQLPFLALKGYKIKYSRRKRDFLFKLLSQIPSILRTIKYEQRWLQKMVDIYKIDAVISDNRFGLYHKTIPAVYMTHQLYIETGINWLNKKAQQIHYQYINRFSQCWVPDVDGNNNLAGKLSHPEKLPEIPIKYLGVLSRFKKQQLDRKTDLLVILSGPEPQRSIFENMILQQLKKINGSLVLVRGLPLETKNLILEENIISFNHLPSKELSMHIQQSTMVVARAGYSTIMDLAILQQKALLVPTPGQAEQEYLADYLKMEKLFYTCSQDNFNFQKELLNATLFYKTEPVSPGQLNVDLIHNWLTEIKNAKTSK
jgi:uncharacterized protein (TIGR00661 family)